MSSPILKSSSKKITKEKFGTLRGKSLRWETPEFENNFSATSSESFTEIDIDESANTLDLSGRGISNLHFLLGKKMKKMTQVILSNNRLDSITALLDFPQLKIIKADQNLLSDVRLKFSHLIELDLSQNKLTEVRIFHVFASILGPIFKWFAFSANLETCKK